MIPQTPTLTPTTATPVEIGNTVELLCDYPIPGSVKGYTWRQTTNDDTFFTNTTTDIFTLHNVNMSNTGHYSCRAVMVNDAVSDWSNGLSVTGMLVFFF